MISYIEGKCIDSDTTSVTLLAGSVGYRVFVPGSIAHAASTSKEVVSLYTYLHVKEGILDLFGFESQKQREIFELLISVSGIGPRTALGILDAGSADDIVNALAHQNEGFFTSVSGIGPRGAKKLIFELKNKMSNFNISDSPIMNSGLQDASDALSSMGYSMSEINIALSGADLSQPPEHLIKHALKELDSHSQ